MVGLILFGIVAKLWIKHLLAIAGSVIRVIRYYNLYRGLKRLRVNGMLISVIESDLDFGAIAGCVK